MFQYPTSGFSLFYGAKFKETLAKLACFNALLRAFLFSTHTCTLWQGRVIKFQCPTSGFSLFYTVSSAHNDHAQNVSMPYFGLFSFLLRERMIKMKSYICFNALLRAFLFSTLRKKEINSMQKVSMPYFGLFSFLLMAKCKATRKAKVSMPYFGLFSFLHYGSTTLDFAGFANPFLRVII